MFSKKYENIFKKNYCNGDIKKLLILSWFSKVIKYGITIFIKMIN